MSKPVMKTTPDQWHGLVEAVGKARDGSKTVKVDRDALNQLISDHAALLHHHKGEVEGYT